MFDKVDTLPVFYANVSPACNELTFRLMPFLMTSFNSGMVASYQGFLPFAGE